MVAAAHSACVLLSFARDTNARLALVRPRPCHSHSLSSRLFEWEWATHIAHPWEITISTFVRSRGRRLCAQRPVHALARVGRACRFLRANYACRIDCVNAGSADAFTFYIQRYSLAPAAALNRPAPCTWDHLGARMRAQRTKENSRVYTCNRVILDQSRFFPPAYWQKRKFDFRSFFLNEF